MPVSREQPAQARPSLSNYAMSRVGTISAFAPNCKRVRFRKNDCRQCLKACPENAISLDPGPAISQACTECGLCVTACPTEVFRDEDRHEQNLWRQASEWRASLASKRQKETLCVSCHKGTQPGKDSLSIHCLGNITAYFVAALAFLGWEELQFTTGTCSGCHLKEGERLLLNSIQTARTLLDGTRYAGFIIRLEDRGQEKVFFSRRLLFSPVATAFRSAQRGAGTKSPEDAASALSGRKLLCHLLSCESSPALPRIQYSPNLPLGKIAIDEALCSGCGICTAVCPTGALVENPEGECKVLRFDSAVCINCRLCSEACPQNAVGFKADFRLSEVVLDEAQVVARIEMSECVLCGDRIRAGKGDICPTCEKRQLSQIYLSTRRTSKEAASSKAGI